MTLKTKRISLAIVIVLSILITLLYIAFSEPKDVFSKFPKVIDINSKYYLQKIVAIDYDIIELKDELAIVQDTSLNTDFSMGIVSLDGNIIIQPKYKEIEFISNDIIKGWISETEVSYFNLDGSLLNSGSYSELKSKYEVEEYIIPEYTIETFESTVYSTDENGNPRKVIGKYVSYGVNQKEIVFPLNVSFQDVTIANITGKVYVGDVYDDIYYYSKDDGMVLVRKGSDIYYCDLNGNKIFNVLCNFVEDDNGNPCFIRDDYSKLLPIYMFDRGYAITVKNDMYGVINLEGKTIIDFNYNSITRLPFTLYLAQNDNGNYICDISLNDGTTSKYFKNIKFLDDKIILYDEEVKQNLIYSIEINL